MSKHYVLKIIVTSPENVFFLCQGDREQVDYPGSFRVWLQTLRLMFEFCPVRFGVSAVHQGCWPGPLHSWIQPFPSSALSNGSSSCWAHDLPSCCVLLGFWESCLVYVELSGCQTSPGEMGCRFLGSLPCTSQLPLRCLPLTFPGFRSAGLQCLGCREAGFC